MPRRYVIDSVRTIRLLASPLRQALVDTIAATGPSTVAELSRLMHRPADRLYYHLRLLERAGLLEIQEDRSANGRSEARYDVRGRPMYLRYEPKSAANRRAVGRVVDAMARVAKRDFSRAFAEGDVEVHGAYRNLWAGRAQANLTRREVAEVNLHLQRLAALLVRRTRAERRHARLHQLTWILSPSKP